MLLFPPGPSGALAAVVSEDDDAVVRLAPTVRASALPETVQIVQIMQAGRYSHHVAPLLIDAAQLAQAPRVISLSDQRSLAGKGDRIAVEGDLHGIAEFRIVRPSSALRDPLSGEHLGDQAIVLGKALLQGGGAGKVHRFIITSSTQEIMPGDLLMHDAAPTAQVHGARAGTTAVDARIVSIAGGAGHAAQHQVVGINKGARDNIAAGMSLSLFATAESRRAVAKSTQQQSSGSPGNESGRLLIFRVYDRVSYGLITGAVDALQVGDKALAPSTEYTSH